jgi:CRP-like cAMP-binding protein
MQSGDAVECAIIGAEGWVGAQLFGGMPISSIVAFQQIAGTGLRMADSELKQVLQEVPALAALMDLFKGALLAQTMQFSACNRLHDAVSRSARWLLLCCERTGDPDLPLTHEFLAEMLGGGRSSVSATLQSLERDGLVEQYRGHVTIRNAKGLRDRACECHEIVLAIMDRYSESLRSAAA